MLLHTIPFVDYFIFIDRKAGIVNSFEMEKAWNIRKPPKQSTAIMYAFIHGLVELNIYLAVQFAVKRKEAVTHR
ncbi:hypothetical protein PWYN_19620 [Paenibacillus wynnii]|uniref:Uncharacterized protein n=1 Tax=Paenibacillus wynnii TaxID=268407 RepID=A0A098M4D8_9BACL|nr:hypothetical protein PWYN_19620 [Paenibacillus wynnii]